MVFSEKASFVHPYVHIGTRESLINVVLMEVRKREREKQRETETQGREKRRSGRSRGRSSLSSLTRGWRRTWRRWPQPNLWPVPLSSDGKMGSLRPDAPSLPPLLSPCSSKTLRMSFGHLKSELILSNVHKPLGTGTQLPHSRKLKAAVSLGLDARVISFSGLHPSLPVSEMVRWCPAGGGY